MNTDTTTGSDPQVDLEVMPSSALEAINRAEIDVQIATAHKFPRSMAQFKKRATEMATLDEDTAASCIYSRPVGGGKFAEGLSVRMAEIVGASYGNLRVGAMIVSQTERQVVARGFAHDLESNFASTSEVIEATIKKDGRPYDERMRVVIAKAALAKARRDATFQVVPKALCKPIEAECKKVALGDASTLATRRSSVVSWVLKLGIDVARVYAALGIAGEDDMGLDELATLTGLKTAIKDGDVTVDEAFPFLGSKVKTDASGTREPLKVFPDSEPAQTGSGKMDQPPKDNAVDKLDAQLDEKPKRERNPNVHTELEELLEESGINQKDWDAFAKEKNFGTSERLLNLVVDKWSTWLPQLQAFAAI